MNAIKHAVGNPKLVQRLIFDLKKAMNSVIYLVKFLLRSLEELLEESFLDVNNPVVMKDNASINKEVYIHTRKDLGIITHEHPTNSPDVNRIEIVWADMKHIIAEDCSLISSVHELK